MHLRQANSGPIVVGNADGDVLTWDAATGEWEPGAAATAVPLANVRYVDPDSTATPPDGSIGRPFLTVQAALDDLAGTDQCTINITPCNGTAGDLDIPAAYDGSINIVGVCANQVSLETSLESTGFGLGAVMGTITCHGDGSGGNLRVTSQNVNIDALVATDGESPNSVRFMMTGCQCLSVNAPNGRLYAYQSTTRAVTAADAFVYQAQLNNGAPGASFTCPNGLTLDYDTYARCAELGLTLPATTHVVGDCGSAQVTVTVPALLGAELGYATVDVTGTLLDGLSVRDVVVANPVGDLAAAGAGNGAYINCRVSADNTVKLAFLGALAGGDSAFNIAKVSRVIPPPS